jgi:hypothetical protein
MSEIFPTRIREGAIATGTATQWLFNFVFSQITPHAIKNLGWKTFLMFAIFNCSLLAYTWFFIKETKGRSLEEMELRKSLGLSPWHITANSCSFQPECYSKPPGRILSKSTKCKCGTIDQEPQSPEQ